MSSERYRPKTWDDFVGQPIIDEIREACADEWLFDGCGERWLFESDGIAGCGKTSAAYVTARALVQPVGSYSWSWPVQPRWSGI